MEQEHIVIILAALLAISEALALIPSLKNKSILQFIISTLKKFLKKDESAQEIKTEIKDLKKEDDDA